MALKQLRDRMTALYEYRVDPHQLFNLLVSEEDRAVLKRAKELGLRGGTYHSVVTLMHNGDKIQVDCEACSPLPKMLIDRQHKIDPTWPFAAELTEWADNMASVYAKFAIADDVLTLLQETLSSPKQMRYVLPGIVTLLNIADEKELASKLSATPMVRNMPPLPSGSRQPIMDCNALIAQASLLPNRQGTTSGTRFSFEKTVLKQWLAHA